MAAATDNIGIAVKTMRQTAVYWAPTGSHDANGQPTYETPEEISCRWDDVAEEFITATGSRELSRAQLIVDRDLEVTGMILLGTLGSSIDQADPHANVGAWEIRQTAKTPSLRGTKYLREAIL